MGKQNKDRLIYKNSFWDIIRSGHELLSFLRAALKDQSNSTHFSNFTKPERCKMLDVIVWKRH